MEVAPTLFTTMTLMAGVLLIIRELYKDKLIWVIKNEGGLTIIKVVVLFSTGLLKGYESYLLSVVMLLGILSSHLPREVREKGIL